MSIREIDLASHDNLHTLLDAVQADGSIKDLDSIAAEVDMEHTLVSVLYKVLRKYQAMQNALQLISSYGQDGICPYGCDCPNIANEAIKHPWQEDGIDNG